MDFRLYGRVLWRFRWLVAFGLVLGSSLGLLSVLRVSGDGVAYRQSELWTSTTRLGVTQNGFPWGRLLAQEPTLGEQAERLGIPLADPNRLNTLAVLYAELATSDSVRRQMLKDGPLRGKIIATPVVVGENRIMLPFIDVAAIATSPRRAVELAQRAADAFGIFMRDQQRANHVPTVDRVIVQQLVRPKPPKLFQPRSKTMPVVVFLAVMFGVVGLAFLLENLRPRRRPEAGEQAEPDFQGAARRTA